MMGCCSWGRVEQWGVGVSFSNSIPNFHSSNSSTSPFIKKVDLRGTTAGAAYQVTSPSHIPTQNASPNYNISRRRRGIVIQVSKSDLSSRTAAKIANLSARRKETLKLPNYDDGCGRMYPISEFFSHPSAVEAILNTNAFQSFQSLDSNTYRCTLPSIQLLNIEVAPVLDLRVIPTSEDCIIEMLSCKFEGSQAMKRHNDHFSAFMENRITWNANASEPCLDIDVKLDISLEIYTQPFTLLPVSVVEKPGNLVMQSMVDRLVPLLLQQILQDYEKWVQEQFEVSIPETPMPLQTG